MTPYFTILNRVIPAYGVFFYTGIIAAVTVAMLICVRKKIPRYEIAYSGVYTMIGAIFGAKLLFIVISFRQLLEEKITFEAILKGGFVFYGGLVGGALGLLIYTRQYRMDIRPFAEIYSAVLPLGHAFGRLGCYFAGCCYGISYNGLFSHTYKTSIGLTPTDTPLFPVQLLETVGLIILFAVLLTVYLKSYDNKHCVAFIYLIAYPAMRFFTEFLRGDTERGHFIGLSVSQWISIFILLGTMIVLVKTRSKKKSISATNQS